MKVSFEQLANVKKNLLSLPRFLAENAFFFTLGLLALAVALALLLLSLSYGTLKKDAAPQNTTGIEFNEGTFTEMFKGWEQRETDFAGPLPSGDLPQGDKTQNIPNIF